jgi:hypothetical protein
MNRGRAAMPASRKIWEFSNAGMQKQELFDDEEQEDHDRASGNK